MPRRQDIAFGIVGLIAVALMVSGADVIVLALVGAFLCGAAYVLAGMLPDPHESFAERAGTTVFLAIVLACLVLIVPVTLGPPGPRTRTAMTAVAVVLPLAALAFETFRTPGIVRGLLRRLGYW